MVGSPVETILSMSSSLGGDDPAHDWPPEEKERECRRLMDLARELQGNPAKVKERNRILKRLNELMRRKARRAHQR